LTAIATRLPGIHSANDESNLQPVAVAALTNRLLAGLPARDLRRVIARSERVELTLGETLCEAGGRIRHVYFPLDSIISLLVPIEGHGSLEVGLVGTEGMFGSPVALGVHTSPLHALVQGSGSALRCTITGFRKLFLASPPLRRRMCRYIYVLEEQSAQSSACISFHRLEARLARWLLMTQDRMHSDDLHLTHELLAQMLGVRRVGVTNAAGELQKRRIVEYNRGLITVLSRDGLEQASCACYEKAKDSYQRLLG
jgi:CRP-like cAMP-binding protein